MKSIKHRLLSLLLTLVTVLSLLPTAAFAASNTGSGLKITTNQAYWSTRLLANGTPYSYRPPLVDGKLVYCMDSGLGYHYATPSYLNSFTWTSGTGADADAVLQSALTNSGLSEMDAATVENVKWMMTYLNDCKESNVGQLFMAVQTYVWENQSYKGEPGGDGDAGGYANADTYELYLSLIDSLLAKKAAEDAEFQRQIEEYKAQGVTAAIVEDESARWAVYAISSNRKNQSFFNYYGPRKLATQDKPGGGEEPAPPAGVGKIVLKKLLVEPQPVSPVLVSVSISMARSSAATSPMRRARSMLRMPPPAFGASSRPPHRTVTVSIPHRRACTWMCPKVTANTPLRRSTTKSPI